MLIPNKTNFKKCSKGRINLNWEYKANKLRFGSFGLQSLEAGKITAKQIEAVRRTITAKMKRKGKIWIRIFPDIPVTAKPAEVRMGKGKGNVKHWMTRIKAGQVLYEVASSDINSVFDALNSASIKLPVSTRILKKTFKLL